MVSSAGKIKKTVIITGYRCNNNCRFCVDSEKRSLRNKETGEIKAEMIKAKKSGAVYLELIGGETTIRPDIFSLAGFAKRLGFQTITMATNGRMFSDENFAKKMVEAGITSLIFSIHGHNARSHDFLTRAPGSFRQLVQGIKNLRSLGFGEINSNTTIVRQNFKNLPKIADLIFKLGIVNSEFIFADPTYGGVFSNFGELMPKISQVAPVAKKVLDFGIKNRRNWTIRYVPLCHFKKYLPYVSELREAKYFQTQHLAPDFVNFDVENSRADVSRTKTLKCRPCEEYRRCEGIWREYLRHYGDEELKPVRRN